MNEDVKKKLIIFASLFVLLGLIAILISNIKREEKPSDLKLFDNEDKYFSIKSTINSNLNNENLNYIITKILYKTYKETDYCFVNGYTLEYPEFGEATYEGNVNYLLILRGNTYNLYKVNTTNIEEYANSFNDYKEITNGKVLNIINHSEKNKLSSYISNFINLLNYDKNKAYNYLNNKNDNLDKYLNISSNINSYTKNDNYYIVTDSNNNTFKITEESIMNYKIEL